MKMKCHALYMFLLVLPSSAIAELTQVAVTGASVPSILGNGLMSTVEYVQDFQVNNLGQIAFRGYSYEGAGTWFWDPSGQIDVVAYDDQRINGQFLDMTEEDNLIYLSDRGEVVLDTYLYDIGSGAGKAALTWTRDQGLEWLLGPNVQVPGFGGEVQYEYLVSRSPSGTIFSLNTPATQLGFNTGSTWHLDSDGDLSLLMSNNQPASELGDDLRLAHGGVRAKNNSGEMIVSALVASFREGFGYVRSFGQGIWRADTSGNLELLLRPLAPVPGFDDDWAFIGNSNIYLNESGDVTFFGNIVKGGINSPEQSSGGVWRIRSGSNEPELVFANETLLPDAQRAIALTSYKSNEQNTVVIHQISDGIWINKEGADQFTSIVTRGQQLNGIRPDQSVQSIMFPSLNNANQVAMQVRLTDKELASQHAIVATLPGGELSLVVQQGDEIELVNGQFAEFLSFGDVFINDRGQIAFEATLMTNDDELNGVFLSNAAKLAFGDFDGDDHVGLHDVDTLIEGIVNGHYSSRLDLNLDLEVNFSDLDIWVKDARGTWYGDANLDGEFNTADLVTVFQAGQFEDTISKNSRWSDGDWNGDGAFNSSDLVIAFQDGGFEIRPIGQAQTVPEPRSSVVFIAAATALLAGFGRRRRN